MRKVNYKEIGALGDVALMSLILALGTFPTIITILIWNFIFSKLLTLNTFTFFFQNFYSYFEHALKFLIPVSGWWGSELVNCYIGIELLIKY